MRPGIVCLWSVLAALVLVPAGQALAQGAATPGLGPQGSYKPPAPIRPGQPVSVLAFPFGFGDEAPMPAGMEGTPARMSVDKQELSAYVTAGVKAGLLSSPSFAVITYHPQSSLVNRARKDDLLKQEDITGLIAPATGAVDLDKARHIAERLGLQAVLVGNIELKEDPKANSVEVTVDAQLVSSVTNEVLRTGAVSGAAAGAEGVPLLAVRERAAQDAVMKLLPALGIELVPISAPASSGNGKAPKKSDADKKAEAAARKEAERARKAEAEAARRAEREARDEQKRREAEERKAARENARRAPETAAPTPVRADAGPTAARGTSPKTGAAPGASADQEDREIAAAQAGGQAQPMAAAPAPGSVKGTANAAGQPIPYGYALGDTEQARPKRDKRNLRVPAWLGVAGFLAGISFLL